MKETTPPKKTGSITVRIDDELEKKLDAACERTGFDQSKITRICLQALCRALEGDGKILTPLEIYVVGTKFPVL
jgi:hypothetical protein